MVCVSGHEHTRRSTRHNAKLFCHQQTAQLQKVDSRKSQEKAGAQTRAIKTQSSHVSNIQQTVGLLLLLLLLRSNRSSRRVK